MLENERDQDITINPFTMILPPAEQQQHQENQDQSSSTVHAAPPEPQLHHHHLRSIDATLTIRQITSQGLSFQLWPAATAFVTLLDAHRRDPSTSPLARVLSDGHDRRQLSILELGSGTGLVGIAAAVTLGASVTVTDLPHVVPNLRFNAEANGVVLEASGGSVVASGLRWGEAADVEEVTSGREYDLIVASDVVYHDHLYEPLLRTLHLLLSGKTTSFVMAHLRRWKKESAFFRKAKKAFDMEILFQDTPLEGSRVGVVVYRFSWRNKKRSGDDATSAEECPNLGFE